MSEITNKLTAKEGCVFTNPDKTIIYGATIAYGSLQTAADFIEITIGEAEELRRQKEEKGE